MSNTSNFREAMRKAQGQTMIGPNVIANALPFVGGGLVLTAIGTYGGLGMINSNPGLFMPSFFAFASLLTTVASKDAEIQKSKKSF